jgi:predicted dienelactone hydrolase
VYASKLAAGDPCRLPGPEALGPAHLEPAAAEAPLDPLARGPHPIGVTTIELASAGRRILVEIWYPATVEAVGRPTDLYTYPEGAPPQAVDGVEAACLAIEPLDSGAVRDAAPSEAGPFPLVVFSHGTTSTRVQSASVTSHLATHGFVVASPDHTGDTLVEFFESKGGQNPLDDAALAMEVASHRVADVSAIIDALGTPAPDDACFGGLVDGARVGAFGHSFGGFTALAAEGGALFDAGPDARVKAVLPVAPGGVAFTKVGSDPLLAMGGDADVTTTFTEETKKAYDRAAQPKYLVKLLAAGHLTTSDMCQLRLAEQIDVFGFAPCSVCTIVRDGCPGGVEQMLKTRPAMQYFTAAFFVAHLGAGERAARAATLLDPSGPGPAAFPLAWSVAEVEQP